MESFAKAQYVRISPRKVDQILMLVRGKSVAHAISTLRLVTKGARPPAQEAAGPSFAPGQPAFTRV